MWKARPRFAVTSRPRAARNRARSLTCRRMKRMTARSRRRLISCAAPLPTRHSRRIRKLLFAKPRQQYRAEAPRLVATRAETNKRGVAKCGRLRLDVGGRQSNGPDIRITNRGSRMTFAMNWCLSAAKCCRNALLGWAEFLGHADDRRLQDLRRCKLAGDAKRWSRRFD